MRKSRFLLAIIFVAVASASCSVELANKLLGGNVFVVTTDFESGSFSLVDSSTRETSNSVGSIHSDAVARSFGGLVYVINRWGADNIQVLDPADSYTTKLQFSVGAGSNPQDIAFVSATKAYVSQYDTSEILIVDPSTGVKTGSVDISPYADADGLPEATQLFISGDKLYVALQKLDRNAFYAPTGGSEVLVINTGSDSVVSSIALPFQNPTGAFVMRPNGDLVIACSGAFLVADGGLVAINTSSDTASAIMTEVAFGGDMNSVVMTSDSTGFAVVGDALFNTLLKKFDTSTGAATTIFETAGFALHGIAVHGSELWVSDATATNPGVRIFNVSNAVETTSGPINVGLPPFMILFL